MYTGENFHLLSDLEELMKKVLLAIVVLVAASLACSLLSPTATPTNQDQPPVQIQPTLQVQIEPTVQVQSNVLFSDDFSNSSSGWDQVNEDYKITDYANGGYRMWLTETQYDIWANPSEYFSGPVSIEVDATKTAGPDNNDFGIICNYQDIDNFYVGLISSDGYAVIGKVEAGTSTYISSEQMVSVSGINSGSATNHIRFDCNNGTLTLYANGNQVATVFDSSFSSGDVGLQVGTFDEGGVDMLFDNFVVTKP
jgi:hypothetical protein